MWIGAPVVSGRIGDPPEMIIIVTSWRKRPVDYPRPGVPAAPVPVVEEIEYKRGVNIPVFIFQQKAGNCVGPE